jgi:acyl-CoA synthetase (AMP-forming)/AMP-acid ligase II
MDLRVLLDMAVSFDASRVAVTDDEGQCLTTGELQQRARSAAHHFTESGAASVGFCDTNGLTFPVALFGAVLAGVPFVPLNYRLADSQLAPIAAKPEMLVVAGSEQADRLQALGAAHVVPSAEVSRQDGAEQPDAACQSDPEDIALILHTSGTTAAPKSAVLRHRNLAAYVIGTVPFGTADGDEAALLSVPPYHIAGVMNLLSNLYLGRRVVYLEPFEAQRWLHAVAHESITHAMVVPTMLARVVSALAGRQPELPSLRTVAYGGAKMPRTVIETALQLFPGVAFSNAYGLTETSSTIAVLGPEAHRDAVESSDPAIRARLGSAGQTLPGIEIEVRDEAGKPCAPGAVGDIFVRGDQVAGEYADGAATDDGWFATRDRGYLDNSGFLFVEGRADDTIIRGGENIAPAEIEEVFLRHDHVIDCAVVGIDDDEWGQRLGAAVVLAEGAGVTVDELRSYARAHLRTSKTPDLIAVLPELPYTDTGKLVRRLVRDELHAGHVVGAT